MAVFTLFSAAGMGFDMDNSGREFMKSNTYTSTYIISDNGKTAVFGMSGSNVVNKFAIDYREDGNGIVVKDVKYYYVSTNIFFMNDLDIKISESDLQKSNFKIVFTDGDDTFYGNGYRDVIKAGKGNDLLDGGRGKDMLEGGAGDDVFDFDELKDSIVGRNRDTVADFEKGSDKLDLRNLDVSDWIGTKSFTGEEGQLRMSGGIQRWLGLSEQQLALG